MSLYFVIIKKGEIVNTNNVKNVICIIRSSCVLIITKYKDMLRKVMVNKFFNREYSLLLRSFYNVTSGMNKRYTFISSSDQRSLFIFLQTYIFKYDKTFSQKYFCNIKEMFY